MGAKMFHPTSGRANFDMISDKQSAATSREKPPAATNQNSTQPVNEIEIETKTKDAIKNAIKSPTETSSNNTMIDKNNGT